MSYFDKETLNNVSDSIIRSKNRLVNLFTYHPNSQNMTYSQHLKRALTLSLKMGLGSIILFIHSILPFLLKTKGTSIINSLYNDIHIIHNNKTKDE